MSRNLSEHGIKGIKGITLSNYQWYRAYVYAKCDLSRARTLYISTPLKKDMEIKKIHFIYRKRYFSLETATDKVIRSSCCTFLQSFEFCWIKLLYQNWRNEKKKKKSVPCRVSLTRMFINSTVRFFFIFYVNRIYGFMARASDIWYRRRWHFITHACALLLTERNPIYAR